MNWISNQAGRWISIAETGFRIRWEFELSVFEQSRTHLARESWWTFRMGKEHAGNEGMGSERICRTSYLKTCLTVGVDEIVNLQLCHCTFHCTFCVQIYTQLSPPNSNLFSSWIFKLHVHMQLFYRSYLSLLIFFFFFFFCIVKMLLEFFEFSKLRNKPVRLTRVELWSQKKNWKPVTHHVTTALSTTARGEWPQSPRNLQVSGVFKLLESVWTLALAPWLLTDQYLSGDWSVIRCGFVVNAFVLQTSGNIDPSSLKKLSPTRLTRDKFRICQFQNLKH